MRRHTIGVAAGVTCGLWLGATGLRAQPPAGPGEGPAMAPFRGAIERALGLSDTQKTAFQKLLEQQRPEMQALHSELRDARQKLEQALAAENPDPATVGELAIQQHRLIDKQRALHTQAGQALRGLLTPEQQAKFDLLQSMRPGPGGFGARRGPGGRFGHWGGGAPDAGAAPPIEQQ